MHPFERKLGRELTPPERQTLQERLGELGPDRLGDVVMDLAQHDLDAWLARPTG